jgi:lipopolysaccharide export LptBFGC system permease protein LptF
MIFIGFMNWELQERFLPQTNRIQDQLRTQIRSRGVLAQKAGKYWIANDRRIYSFEIEERKASANQTVKNLSIYEFSADESRLQTIYKTPRAVWEKDRIKFLEPGEKTVNANGKMEISAISDYEIPENSNPFNEMAEKPSHLDAAQTRENLKFIESETEQRNYAVALEKKYTTPFLPFVITLFTAPFALSLSRKGKATTVGYAIAIWLLYTGVTTVFDQFGLNGFLSPQFAVWSPLALFTVLGIYLISKIRT